MRPDSFSPLLVSPSQFFVVAFVQQEKEEEMFFFRFTINLHKNPFFEKKWKDLF